MSEFDPCCATCKFWRHDHMSDSDEEGVERIGICLRFPPVSILTEIAEAQREDDRTEEVKKGSEGTWLGRAGHDFCYWAQPRTIETDWCGEYQA